MSSIFYAGIFAFVLPMVTTASRGIVTWRPVRSRAKILPIPYKVAVDPLIKKANDGRVSGRDARRTI